MKISVLRPSFLKIMNYDPSTIFVIIDTLRATTTLSTLKNLGVKKFYIVRNKEDARKLKMNFFPSSLLIGEEHGTKIKDFDYGNSPTALLAENHLSSEQVVFTSSNGSKTMLHLESMDYVYLAALVNLSKTAETVIGVSKANKSEIVIVPAGVFNNPNLYAIEDWITAVYLIEKINKIISYPVHTEDQFWGKTKKILDKNTNFQSLLINSTAGQYLEKIGYAQDVIFCSNFDMFHNFLKVKKWLNFSGLKCVELE